MTVRFDEIPSDSGPERINVTNAVGAPVDTTQLLNLGAYTTPVVASRDIKNNFNNAKFDVTRKFQPADFSWSLKSGALYKEAAKDRAQPQTTRTYAGPAFAALPAGTLTDPDFNLDGPQGTFKTQQWLSTKKAFDLYQTNPAYYTTSAAADYIAWATSLEESSEAFRAGYLMADGSFW